MPVALEALSLRTKLILWLLVPLLAVLSVVLYSDWSRNRRAVLAAAHTIITERSTAVASQIDTRLRSIMRAAETAAALPSRGQSVSENNFRQAVVAPMRFEPAIFAAAFVLDSPTGRPISIAARRVREGGRDGVQFRPTSPRQASGDNTLPWLTAQARKQAMWSGQFTDPSLAAGPLYAFSVPVLESGEVRGVLALILRGSDAQALIAPPTTGPNTPATSVPGGGTLPELPEIAEAEPAPSLRIAQSLVGPDGFVILDSDRLVVMHSNPILTGKDSIFTLAAARGMTGITRAAGEVFSGKAGVVELEGMDQLLPQLTDDDTHILAYSPVPAAGWTFTTALSKAEAMKPVNQWLLATAALLVLGLVAVVLVVFLVSSRLTRPIEQMAEAVDRLGSGDLSVRLDGAKGKDELARLARGFNTTVTRLAAQMQQVRTETAARERIEGELKAARNIQVDLLPRTFPPFLGEQRFDLFALNTPAKYVAGDFYDFFFSGDRLILVIGDVSGKGVAAAMLMAVTRTLVRAAAAEGLGVADIVRRVNDGLRHDSDEGMFVTMFIGSYCPNSGQLEYITAGHPPPILLRPSGPLPLQESNAPMLGVLTEEIAGNFRSDTLTIPSGCGVLVYTDGVTEAAAPGHVLFGIDRLTTVLSSLSASDAAETCGAVSSAATTWQSGILADDITVLVLRRCN